MKIEGAASWFDYQFALLTYPDGISTADRSAAMLVCCEYVARYVPDPDMYTRTSSTVYYFWFR
jgi:hypothetical protein